MIIIDHQDNVLSSQNDGDGDGTVAMMQDRQTGRQEGEALSFS
jgi:hypothetical protein